VMGNCSSYGFNIGDVGSTFPNCRAVGNASYGFFVNENAVSAAGFLDDIVSHSNNSEGLYMRYVGSTVAAPITGAVLWRNNSNATYFYGSGTGASHHLASPVVFGNSGFQLFQFGGHLRVTSPMNPVDIAAYTGAQPVSMAYGGLCEIIGGSIDAAANIGASSVVVNGTTWTNFAAPTFTAREVGEVSHLLSFRHNGVEDDHRAWYRYGATYSNAVTRHTPSGLSWQCLPSGGVGVWFRPNIPLRLNCPPNVEITASAWVYVDAAYNGTAKPRIVVLGGHLQGIPADVIGDSHSGALGWERLTVQATATEQGRLPYVIEGQGNAGSFYVDDVRLEW